MPLYVRITLAVAVLGALLTGALLWVTLTHSLNSVREQLFASEQVMMDLVGDLSKEALLTEDYAELQAYVERARRHPRVKEIVLADTHGFVVVATQPEIIGTSYAAPDSGPSSYWLEQMVRGHANRLGTLAVEFSDQPLITAYRTTLDLGLIVATGGILASAAVGLLIGWALTFRLRALAEAADRVAAGGTEQPFSLYIAGRDEVARVARAFASMVTRLGEHVAALRAARDRLLQPTEAMSQGFALWDADNRLTSCNQRLRDLVAPVGDSVYEGLSFDAYCEAIREHLLDPSEAGEPGEWLSRCLAFRADPKGAYEIRLRDGRCLELREVRTPDGGTVGIYTDVTSDRQQRRALAASERRLRATMDSVFDAVVTTDDRARVDGLNPAAERIFGWPAAEAQGLPIGALISPVTDPKLPAVGLTSPQLAAMPADALREMRGRRYGGALFPIEVSAARVELDGRSAYICTVRDISERKLAEQRIVHHATHDRLTSLPNRSLLEQRLKEALRVNQSGQALMFLDLDRFKVINDTLGHFAGDGLLVAVAQRLKAQVRASDTVARMGGDEFILLLRDAGEPRQVAEIGNKLLEAIRLPFHVQGHQLHVTASIGVSLFPAHGTSTDLLLRHADVALYRAKSAGRNRLRIYAPAMNARANERIRMETELRGAIERGELALHYQPQVAFATGELRRLEALMRWQHGTLGEIPPDEFIPLAEESDLICVLGRWALREACRQLRAWQRRGLRVPQIAVNVSARELEDESFALRLADAIGFAGVAPRRVELELTERILMREGDGTAQRLHEVAALGVGLTLDDFGTGYSSLSYLKRYPIHRLKVDRSFVAGLEASDSDGALVQATIAMARALGIKVVAEGIESETQWRLLAAAGCDDGQGFFVGRPFAPERAADMLAVQLTVPQRRAVHAGWTPGDRCLVAPPPGQLVPANGARAQAAGRRARGTIKA